MMESAARIGARLRRVRRQQGLSLADVEERSDGAWKAVVVGAYERGDRTMSISRLAGLAEFYGLPLAELLPSATATSAGRAQHGVVLDLTSLTDDASDPTAVVVRFAERVQRTRGDHNGRMLSLRASDVELLALTAGTSAQELLTRLQDEGALVAAPEAGMAAPE